MSDNGKRHRQILGVEGGPMMRSSPYRSIWVLPQDHDRFPDTSSFELLGAIQTLDSSDVEGDGGLQTKGASDNGSLFRSMNALFIHDLDQPYDVDGSAHLLTPARFPEYEDQRLDGKLVQAVQAVGLVLGCQPLTVGQAVALLGGETMRLLLAGANVFTLIERFWTDPSASESVWRHSLRTASLAGLIAKHEQVDRQTVLHACSAGIVHDIGILVLATLEPDRYEKVRIRALKQNRSLASVEKEVFRVSHQTVGASLLQRMHVPSPIVEAVAYHDEPFRSLVPECTAVTAVYAANVLDGGGWAHDSDGVPSPWAMEYLASRGLASRWPTWREYLRGLDERAFWRV